MIDRIANLTLTFAVLIGSTLAIGADFYNPRQVERQAAAIVELPRVVITGSVTRDATVAKDDQPSDTRTQ